MNHKRLHTRLLALLLCCALVLPLSACGEAKSTTQQIFAMDTVMDLTAYGKKADDGISAAISIINSMDTLLDPENERSKTYEINHAMGSSVVVNEQIAKMLRTAQTVYERSDGARPGSNLRRSLPLRQPPVPRSPCRRRAGRPALHLSICSETTIRKSAWSNMPPCARRCVSSRSGSGRSSPCGFITA